jgi:hypothetical protein
MTIQTPLLILLVGIPALGASECTPPPAAVAELKAYLSYVNGLESARSVSEPFTVLNVDGRTFFRLDAPPPGYVPDQRPVYVYDPPRRMPNSLTCPADATWVNCVGDWLAAPASPLIVSGDEKPRFRGEAPKEPTCEFTLDVPAWEPSPDNQQKRKLAAELLQELRDSNSGAEAIYVRDFNTQDPDIWAYVINGDGSPAVQGCFLDPTRVPHCQWHRFGQSPLDWLKQQIMQMPYRLYPPPIGATQVLRAH